MVRTVSSNNGAAVRPLVGVRIRPESLAGNPEACGEPQNVWKVHDKKKLSTETYSRGITTRQQLQAYQVDSVFHGHDSQNYDVFDELVDPLVESAFDYCQNGIVFAYGQTSSGKTHTIHGDLHDRIGLVGYALQSIIEKQPASLQMSCYQIHLDNVTDLLNDAASTPCTPKTITPMSRNRGLRACVVDKHTIYSYDQAASMLATAAQNREKSATRLNQQSSRSHMVVQLDIEPVSGGGSACIVLVDLAGSEDPRKSGANGKALSEAISINLSLLTLQHVISSWAANPYGHIPYEDSTLTRKLKPSLSANSRISILVTIRCEKQFQSESIRTLKFAETAARITCKPVAHKVDVPDTRGVDQVLRLRIQTLEAKCQELEAEKATMTSSASKLKLQVTEADDVQYSLRLQLAACQRQISQLTQEIQERDAHIQSLGDVSASKVAELEKALADTEAKLAQSESVSKVQEWQLQQQQDKEVEARVQRMEQSIKERQQIDKHAVEVSALKAQLVTAVSDLHTAQATITMLESQLASEVELRKSAQQDHQDVLSQLAKVSEANEWEVNRLNVELENLRAACTDAEFEKHEIAGQSDSQLAIAQYQHAADLKAAQERHAASQHRLQAALKQAQATAASLLADKAALEEKLHILQEQAQSEVLHVQDVNDQVENEVAVDGPSLLQAAQQEVVTAQCEARQAREDANALRHTNDCLLAQLHIYQQQQSQFESYQTEAQQELQSTVLLAAEAADLYKRVQQTTNYETAALSMKSGMLADDGMTRDTDLDTVTTADQSHSPQKLGIAPCKLGSPILGVTSPRLFTARAFKQLPGAFRSSLVKELCALAGDLVRSVKELRLHGTHSTDPAVQHHRNASQQLVFCYSWLVSQIKAVQAQDDQEERTSALDQGKKTKKGKGKAAGTSTAKSKRAGDWLSSLERLAIASTSLLQLDMPIIFPIFEDASRMINLCMEMAVSIFTIPEACKDRGLRNACIHMTAGVAILPNHLANVADTLTELSRREEHCTAIAVEVAMYVEKHCPSISLGLELLKVFLRDEPSVYDAQASSTAASVKQAAELLVGLAEAFPKMLVANLSQLLPYFGCSTPAMRSAVVKVLKTVLIQVLAHKEVGAECGQEVRVTSKHRCLAELSTRLLDKSAFVRVDVLKAFAELIQKSAIPLQAWPQTLDNVFGCLQDGSVMVQKAALQTLHAIIEDNPWGSRLSRQDLSATITALEAQEKELRESGRFAAQDDDEDMDGSGPGGGDVVVWQDGDALTAGETQAAAEEVAVGTETQTDMLLAPTQQPPQQACGSQFQDPVQLGHMIATLKTGIQFADIIHNNLPVLRELLLTSSADVVKETIALITLFTVVGIEGTDQVLRGMWACIFSREESVRDTVVDCVYNIHLSDAAAAPAHNRGDTGSHMAGPLKHAAALSAMMHDVALSESAALEEVLRVLCNPDSGWEGDTGVAELHPRVMKAFTKLAEQYYTAAVSALQSGDVAVHTTNLTGLRCTLYLLALVAPYRAVYVLPWLPAVGGMLKGCLHTLEDAWCVRQCCLILKATGPALLSTDRSSQAVHAACIALIGVMSSNKLGDDGWFCAADAAVAALYVLHQQPEQLMQPLLFSMAASALTPNDMELQALSHVSASHLSRCVFLIGHTAIHHLAHIDNLAKHTRAERTLTEKLACETSEKRGGKAKGDVVSAAGKQQAGGVDDDIAAQVGGNNSVGKDAALDILKEQAEAQLLSPTSFLYTLATGVVARLCMPDVQPLLQGHETLVGSLLLSLVKLMSVDASFCDHHVQLLMHWVTNTALPADMRSSLVVGLADLTTRYPNVIEPWTAHMYQPLRSVETSVRRTALTVLSHLILNDMMKVKGHIANVALCILDNDADIAAWARRFFTTLAHRSSGAKGGSNPIYNLLPDILSALAKELPTAAVQKIMQVLLPFVKDSKQGDSFREKLCRGFENWHEHQAATAADFSAAAAAERQQHQETHATDDTTSKDNPQPVKPEPESQVKQEVVDTTNTGPTGMDVDSDSEAPASVATDHNTETTADGLSKDNELLSSAAATHTTNDTQAATAGISSDAQSCDRNTVVRQWRTLALCYREMGYTEKSTRKIMEMLRIYKHALGDKEVFAVFWSMADHAKKHGDKTSDIRDLAMKYMAEIQEIHKALRLGMSDPGDEEQLNIEQQAHEDNDTPSSQQHQDGIEGQQDVTATQQHLQGSTGSRATGRAAGRPTRSAGSTATRPPASRQGAKGKATRGRNTRHIVEESEEEEEEEDGIESVDASDDVCSQAAGKSSQPRAQPMQRGGRRNTVAAVNVKASTTQRRKARKHSSDDDDDDDDLSDDVMGEGDQGHGEEADNLSGPIKQMQRLRVTSSKTTDQTCEGVTKQKASSRPTRGAMIKQEPIDV